MVCKHCGYCLYGKSVGKEGKRGHYAYYRCLGTDSNRFEGKRVCENKQVRTDLLDEAVWTDVCSLLQDPSRIEEEFRRRLREDKGVAEENVEQMRARTQKLKRSIARLIDAYGEGLLEKDEFEPRIRNSKKRLERIEVDLNDAEQDQNRQQELRLAFGRIEDFAERVSGSLEGADWNTRREVVRALVKRVEVDEASVKVVYRVDPRPFVEAASGEVLQRCFGRRVGRRPQVSEKESARGPNDGPERRSPSPAPSRATRTGSPVSPSPKGGKGAESRPPRIPSESGGEHFDEGKVVEAVGRNRNSLRLRDRQRRFLG